MRVVRHWGKEYWAEDWWARGNPSEPQDFVPEWYHALLKRMFPGSPYVVPSEPERFKVGLFWQFPHGTDKARVMELGDY